MDKRELIKKFDNLEQVKGSGMGLNWGHPRAIENMRQDIVASIEQLEEPEKVVIPEYVAEWIEKERGDVALMWAMDLMIQRGHKNDKRVADWLNFNHYNQNTFAKAWLDDDYTVEEKEKKYYVNIPYERLGLTSYSYRPMTEIEIRNIDDNLMPFAVEVTK